MMLGEKRGLDSRMAHLLVCSSARLLVLLVCPSVCLPISLSARPICLSVEAMSESLGKTLGYLHGEDILKILPFFLLLDAEQSKRSKAKRDEAKAEQ